MSDTEIQVLNHRVTTVEGLLESAISEIRDGIKEIAANTGKLAILGQRHAETRDGLGRAFDAISKCELGCKNKEDRIRTIEIEMPGLREVRRWVVAGILSGVGLVLVAVVAVVLK